MSVHCLVFVTNILTARKFGDHDLAPQFLIIIIIYSIIRARLD